jgi:hypothetical protein
MPRKNKNKGYDKVYVAPPESLRTKGDNIADKESLKDYHYYVANTEDLPSKDRKSFDNAFAKARRNKQKTFTWRGNSYNTKLRRNSKQDAFEKAESRVTKDKPKPPSKKEPYGNDYYDKVYVAPPESLPTKWDQIKEAQDKPKPKPKPKPKNTDYRAMNKGGMVTKSRTGNMDYRKGGLTLSSVDNRKKKK